MLWCVMIIVVNVLFTFTIVITGFRTNILLGYTQKSHRNEFNNYFSLGISHWMCYHTCMWKEKLREIIVKKRELWKREGCYSWTGVLNNVWFGHIYRKPINTSLMNRYLILTIHHFSWSIITSLYVNNHFFLYPIITSFRVQQLPLFIITSYFNKPPLNKINGR